MNHWSEGDPGKVANLRFELEAMGATAAQATELVQQPERARAAMASAGAGGIAHVLTLFRSQSFGSGERKAVNLAGSGDMTDEELERVERAAEKRAEEWKRTTGLSWVMARDPDGRGSNAGRWRVMAQADGRLKDVADPGNADIALPGIE